MGERPVRRTPLVADRDTRSLRIGPNEVVLGPDADPLSTYLSMVYALRGLTPGARLHLRDEDLDVLAGLVGYDPAQVEARLVDLMGFSEEEARELRIRLFRRRAVATATGIAIGLGALGIVAAVEHRDQPAHHSPETTIVFEPPASP